VNESECRTIRELIPDLVGHRLATREISSVEAHIAECGECRAERELARMIFASRTAVPDVLAERVMGAVRRDTRTPHRPWWGLTAAAVAALALGIGIASDREPASDFALPDFAYEVEEGALWVSDDGLVAGAPALDGLSVEDLLELLDELTVGSAGGSV